MDDPRYHPLGRPARGLSIDSRLPADAALSGYAPPVRSAGPDRKPGKKPAHGHDYFALGGLLIKKEDENSARENHKLFCERWGIVEPLHSSEIRAQSNNFSFIGKLETPQKDIFYEELYNLMKDIPVLGIACVIDRPGYNDRYLARYGGQRWDLCKTAFSICVQRAAKFAALNNSRLKVFPERSDPSSDKKLKEYYDSLRKDGLPFDPGNSHKYTPLQSTDLYTTLCEFPCHYGTFGLLDQTADGFVAAMGGTGVAVPRVGEVLTF